MADRKAGKAKKRAIPSIVAAALVVVLAPPVALASTPAKSRSTKPPNVVILMSDDQRWDVVTPQFMPHVYERLIDPTAVDARFPNTTHVSFVNSFVPNPFCCPSRTSTLTGNYSHTTGVWYNSGTYGGFGAFDDKHTIAVDFDQAGYRTGMIGKYLNGYIGGTSTYVPPGWDEWFAANTGAYYNYGITASGGTNSRLLHYGSRPRDYITRVLDGQAQKFVSNAKKNGTPFFLYYAFTTPHGPSTPDPKDVGRFAGADAGPPITNEKMLESAYGVDRAVNHLLDILPANTIVIYMSDNGYLWGETKGSWGSLYGKQWPYNESIRVPMELTSLNGTYNPVAGVNDIVLNVDLRTTLTHAVGIAPLTRTEGINWNGPDYVSRTVFPLEHFRGTGDIPTYCGAREQDWMYVRFRLPSGEYQEELYYEPGSEAYDWIETDNLADDPIYQADLNRLRTASQNLCDPAPPGYS